MTASAEAAVTTPSRLYNSNGTRKIAAAACFDIGRVLKAVILIVEDVMFIREIAEGMIQDWGRNESSGLRSIQTIGGGK
jgi:hypothetical protein